MMRLRPLAALAALAVAASGAAIYYVRRPAPQQTQLTAGVGQATPAPNVIIIDATPLPATFESKGLAGRRFGVMRVYVSAAPEIALKGESKSSPGATLSSVPILVVLENDSYREVDAKRDLGLRGNELFSVEIKGPLLEGVFRESRPAEDTLWGPAERKSFELNWHPVSPTPGQYIISVKPSFGDAGEVQLSILLK
jgi:hypothetical protein